MPHARTAHHPTPHPTSSSGESKEGGVPGLSDRPGGGLAAGWRGAARGCEKSKVKDAARRCRARPLLQRGDGDGEKGECWECWDGKRPELRRLCEGALAREVARPRGVLLGVAGLRISRLSRSSSSSSSCSRFEINRLSLMHNRAPNQA